MSFLERIFTTNYDWTVSMLGWMYTLSSCFSAVRPRSSAGGSNARVRAKPAFVAACCWGGGLLISALGVYAHQIWLMWLGSGVIGGIGLGLGYISPVSTLIKWFPDRAAWRRAGDHGLRRRRHDRRAARRPTDELLRSRYLGRRLADVCRAGRDLLRRMMLGAFGYRLPPPGWQPAAGASQRRQPSSLRRTST